MRRTFGAAVLIGVAWVGAAAAFSPRSHWADILFSETGHDFGPVPRGAKVRHPFVLTNRLDEPLNIVNLRASCGCTSGHASVNLVPPGGQAIVEAEMDTRNFAGPKHTTLFVTLMTASGREAEVRLAVSSNILSDIVLNPGTIDFGTVARGETATRTLTIDRLGAPNWAVQRMVSASRVIDAALTETTRTSSSVGYSLSVKLKPDAPAGLVRDEIRILTNDPETPSIPVLVTALIRGGLSASPSVLALGKVGAATGAQGRFLVRGSQPFTIVGIEGAGDGFQLSQVGAARKNVQILTATFRPQESRLRGDLKRTFRVVTDLPGEAPLDLTVMLHVDP